MNGMKVTSQAIVVSILMLTSATTAGSQATTLTQKLSQETQARGYWADTSGLTWAAKDSDKAVSWDGAMKYCRKLRLAGYSDWRLPTIVELRDIYDAGLETPGRAGYGKGRPFTWHVKGGLFLRDHEWSSARGLDDRGHPTGFAWYFDFNSGEAFNYDEPSASKRALCVRRASE